MKFVRFVLAAAAISASLHAHALQIVEAVEGHNAFVKISAKETTRIAIEGGKIASLIGTDGELLVDKDPDRGQLFVRPAVLDKPINVRLLTASGATYNLIMQAVDIPQEDVIVREPAATRAARADRGGRYGGDGFKRIVRNLVSAMALEEPPSAVDVRPANEEFALWEHTRFVLTAVYSERELTGEKYVLTNTGSVVVRLVEQELFRRGVVAVAIENMQLDAGQSTHVYVVRSN